MRIILFSVVTLLLVSSGIAQTNKATVSGTVKDGQGAVVVGASVTVTNTATGSSRKTTTNDNGFYEVPILDIGTYRITVTKDGFQTVKRENVVLQTATETSVDIELPTGQVSAEVVVDTAPPLVQTETSDRGTVVSGREVTELPLPGRNFTQLAILAPGIDRGGNVGVGGTGPDARSFNNGDPRAGSGGPGASNAQGSTESSRFARSGGFNIVANGQRPTNNNFSVDGVDNNETNFGTIAVATNPDSIAEFKVSTSVPSAEVGRASGAVINVTTKGGSNEFSGSLYYYGQNSALNAYHPMLKRDRALAIANNAVNPPVKATNQIHEFGGNLGGPIIKNKLFFYGSYLGQRNNLPFPAASSTPTVLSRNGNFSEFDAPLLNPFTGQPFPGNIIPANLISGVGRRFFAAHPLPTINIRNPSQGNNNYFTERANKERINNFEIRLDYIFNEKNSLTGRFEDQKLFTTRANLLPGLPTAGFGAGDERGDSRKLTISDVHTFNPNFLNEFRFGLTEINIAIFNCGVKGACGVSPTFAQDLGIPNSNNGTDAASGGTGLGTFGNGFTEFTGDGGLFQVKSRSPYFADTLTIIKGNNTLKVGAELRFRMVNTIDGGRSGFLKGNLGYGDNGPSSQPIQPGQVCPAASTSGTNCFVDPNGIPYGGTGNAQANLLMGLPAFQASRGNVFGGPFNLRSQEYGFFVQDDWKATDRLTINAGLRYDLFTPPTETTGRISYYDISLREVVVAADAKDRIVKTDVNNIGPRIGMAYSIDKNKNVVIRAGYGLLYTLDGIDYPPGIRNPPFTNSVQFNQFEQAPGNRTYFGIVNGPPSVNTQISPTNLPDFASVYAVDLDQKTGFVHQFQAGVQWQFAKDYSLDVAYVGNRSKDLLTTFNIGRGGTAGARNRNNQFLNSALFYSNAASSKYDGLQANVKKRMSNNFLAEVAYTYSKTTDNATGVITSLGDSRSGGRTGPINPFDLEADRGTSSLDSRHLLTVSSIVDLPFGKGKAYLNQGGAVDKLIGGWQANVVFRARSGFPFTVVCNNAIVRPNLIGDPFANVPTGRYFNAAAFNCADSQTNLNRVVNGAGDVIRWGNLPRNSFTGPAIYNTDFSVFKNTQINEKWKVQFGMEFYNLFNSTKLTVPNNNVTDTGAFGRFDGAFPGRIVQYRLKLLF